MQKHIAIVCNPGPEGAKSIRVAQLIGVLLSVKKIDFKIFDTSWPDDWQGFTDVWILGGDGTVNYFVNKYPAIELPLSTFKAGSGNDFHWMLYGDITVEQQVEKLLGGTVQWIDAGSCNGTLFLNGVGIGFDGAIVKDLLGKKKLAGKASYLLSILKNIIGYHEQEYSIIADEEAIVQECFMISVANGKRYGGGFAVAPRASVRDGKLDLNIVGKVAPLKRIKLLPLIEKGEHLHLPLVLYRQAAKIIIETASPVHAHLDGEYLTDKHFEIECLPKKFLFSV